MKTKSGLTVVALLIIFNLGLYSCKDEEPEPQGVYQSGIFITNEGPYLTGSGTVSFFDRSTRVATQNIFEVANGRHWKHCSINGNLQ